MARSLTDRLEDLGTKEEVGIFQTEICGTVVTKNKERTIFRDSCILANWFFCTKCKQNNHVRKKERKKERVRKNALRNRDKLNSVFIQAEKACRLTQGTRRMDNRNAQARKTYKCMEDEACPLLWPDPSFKEEKTQT